MVVSMVDKIKIICKAKKITISKLEDDLGFAKGYIYKLDKSSPSVENAKKIADYLHVSITKII